MNFSESKFANQNNTLDYFNDKKNDQNPNRKNLKPTAKWTFDDLQPIRQAKQEEWRKALREQVQEKKKKSQEDVKLPEVKPPHKLLSPRKPEKKSNSDLDTHLSMFKTIMDKLRKDADQAEQERNETIKELENYREQLRKKDSFSPTPDPRNPLDQRPLFSESKFVPLVSAGQFMVSSNFAKTSELAFYELKGLAFIDT